VELSGQTIVVLGGSAGVGLATAHHARAAGADVNLTGRDPARLEEAAREVGALRAGVDEERDHLGVAPERVRPAVAQDQR
jgi:short-subunit dehydrogenase involved in D-alanine esterification of teichoic acids